MFRNAIFFLVLVTAGAFVTSCGGSPTVPGDDQDNELLRMLEGNYGYALPSVIAYTRALKSNTGTINNELYAQPPFPTGNVPAVRLTNNPADDDWASFSPKGFHIAFISNRSSGGYGSHDIFRFKPFNEPIQLTDDTWQWNALSTDWAPGFIVSSRLNNLIGAPFDVVTMHKFHPSTGELLGYFPGGTASYDACSNHWGSAICYATRVNGGFYIGDTELFVYYPEGDESVRITFFAGDDPDFDNMITTRHPAFSFQGDKIVFQTNYWGSWDLAYVTMGNVGASEPVRLTNTKANEMNPCFSPNGRWIAYVSDENDNNFELYKMYIGPTPDPTPPKPVRLTWTPEDESNPDWSQSYVSNAPTPQPHN
ncbi:MAG TPA: hypothetical protein VGB30_09620 [bacterium]|jgi:hypothetical protein